MELSPLQATFSATTRDVAVSVTPEYLPDESHPEVGFYVWAYHVRIDNVGQRKVQLMNRHWMITDATGLVNEVRGPGVVGEQPVIRPGEGFEYSSGTHLQTAHGVMYGEYEMTDEDGNRFRVAIPMFSLDVPEHAVVLH